MAKRKCISACVEVEESTATIRAFLETIAEAANDALPSWLVVLYVLVGSLESDLQSLGREVRK